MRIVQHKNPNPERPGKDQVEIIGRVKNIVALILRFINYAFIFRISSK